MMRSTVWGLCAFLLSALSLAQAPPAVNKHLEVTVKPEDSSAAQQAKPGMIHVLPTAGHRMSRETVDDAKRTASPAAAATYHPPAVRTISQLTNQGGPVMPSAEQHALYMIPSNGACPSVAVCWGDPEQFLHDLGRSEFIHITDQYVGTTANVRYTVGVSGTLHYTIPVKPLIDTDIQGIVHAMVVADGGLSGYGHEYHVFLPPGQDECFDATDTTCASNVFCAYHGSVDFTDVGHVIYSVEPYANVPGCSALQPDGSSPNSQNSILSHETIESITDPDGTAWWNATGNLDLYGYEIGDECQWINFIGNNVGFLFDPVYLNGRLYYIQSEYNNRFKGCTDSPHPDNEQ